MLEKEEHFNGMFYGSDIMLLSDPQIICLGIINNGGMAFEEELETSNLVVKNFLGDNPTYVDYLERYHSYHEIASSRPATKWRWFSPLLPAIGILFILYRTTLDDTWRLIVCIVAIVLVFVVFVSSDMEAQRSTYNESIEKLVHINKRIFRSIIGFSFNKRNGYVAPDNLK